MVDELANRTFRTRQHVRMICVNKEHDVNVDVLQLAAAAAAAAAEDETETTLSKYVVDRSNRYSSALQSHDAIIFDLRSFNNGQLYVRCPSTDSAAMSKTLLFCKNSIFSRNLMYGNEIKTRNE